jgi:hypothetical protein
LPPTGKFCRNAQFRAFKISSEKAVSYKRNKYGDTVLSVNPKAFKYFLLSSEQDADTDEGGGGVQVDAGPMMLHEIKMSKNKELSCTERFKSLFKIEENAEKNYRDHVTLIKEFKSTKFDPEANVFDYIQQVGDKVYILDQENDVEASAILDLKTGELEQVGKIETKKSLYPKGIDLNEDVLRGDEEFSKYIQKAKEEMQKFATAQLDFDRMTDEEIDEQFDKMAFWVNGLKTKYAHFINKIFG